jgi:primosomal protein N' (replication factor Y)
MKTHLARDGQVLLFLNRRGFAPTPMCHHCGVVAQCKRCDAHYTLHKINRLRCHHCASEVAVPTVCPHCQANSWLSLGQGTERIEAALQRHFP